MPGVTIYSWKADDIKIKGNVPNPDRVTLHYSGIGCADFERNIAHFTDDIERYGHAIVVAYSVNTPTNHHMIGTGAGHDDAKFCEARDSMAAYYENGTSYLTTIDEVVIKGNWWENYCLYCKQPILTNGTGVNGSVTCPGDSEGHQTMTGRHIPTDKCTFRYYNPMRDINFTYAMFNTAFLRLMLDEYRQQAEKAWEKHNWAFVKEFEAKCRYVASVIRWRQQIDMDESWGE